MDKNNLEKRNLDEEIENELERLENDEDDMEIIEDKINNENKDSQSNILNINEIKEYIKELENKTNKNLQSNELVNNLTKANTYIISLKQELSFLLNKIVNIYSDIFPQLSSLITIPLFYIKTIKVIEEKEIFRKKGIQDIKDDLSFLPSNIYLSLSLVLNNAKERMEYRENDINITEKIKSIYSQYLDLNNILEQIQNFINKNMPKIAPNLTELV
jgi:RNA processing factor Prp31